MFQVLATLLTHYEFRKGIISGGVLFFYWMLLSFLGVVPFRSNIMHLQNAEQVSSVYWHGHRLTFGPSLGSNANVLAFENVILHLHAVIPLGANFLMFGVYSLTLIIITHINL